MKTSDTQLPLFNNIFQNLPIKLKIFSALRMTLQRLLESFVGGNDLRIWQTYDREGNNWWHAYDPVTGRYTSVDSEAEMQAWIKQHYYQ
jgi:hypothetical protein